MSTKLSGNQSSTQISRARSLLRKPPGGSCRPRPRRIDRQPVFAHLLCRSADGSPLRSLKVRPAGHDARIGHGMGDIRHTSERCGAGLFPNRNDRGVLRRSGMAGTDAVAIPQRRFGQRSDIGGVVVFYAATQPRTSPATAFPWTEVISPPSEPARPDKLSLTTVIDMFVQYQNGHELSAKLSKGNEMSIASGTTGGLHLRHAVSVRRVSKVFGDFHAVAMLPSTCQGRFLTILGPSGSGKTTLLRMIAGFDAHRAATSSSAASR